MTSTTTLPKIRPLHLRLGVAGVLLLLEYLAISFAFDAQTVGKRGGIWSVLSLVGNVGPLLVVGATAFLLLPSMRSGDDAQTVRAPNVWVLALHVVFGAAFAGLTSAAFGSEQAPPGPAILWLLGWASVGAATAASLFVGMLGEWRWLVQSLTRAVAAGGILGFAGWLAGSLSTQLWAPLSYATFLTVGQLLRWLSFDLVMDRGSAVLQLDDFAVDVAPVCSGFEGIGLFAALMLAFLYRFRRTLRFPNALLLLPLGMAAVWFGNAVRIALLMILGARVDAHLAVGSFHSKAGWVFFCAITLAVAAIGRKLPFFAKREREPASSDEPGFENPTAPLLLPVLCWVAIGLVTSAFAEGHDPLYPLRVVGAGVVLFLYRKSYMEFFARPSVWSWPLGAAVGAVWLLPILDAPLAAEATAPVPTWSSAAYWAWVVCRVVGAVILIPVCEELAFRGYLARFLTKRDFWDVSLRSISLLAIALSSLAFGLIHDRWLLGALTGVAYALLVRSTGKLADAIAAHAASNAVIAAWVLSTGNFQYW